MSSEQNTPSEYVVPPPPRGDERRKHNDRRQRNIPVAVERRSGKDRRQLGERRRQVDPTTCELDYTGEEVEFMRTMDIYKRLSGRQFPTWTEVLEVLHSMGYRKIAEPTALPGQPGHINRRQQALNQSS